jgi:hypothetical protein
LTKKRIAALGAETQAASSLAAAYPEAEVLMISDQPVVDGWDLPNARFHHARVEHWAHEVDTSWEVVPLCSRWLAGDQWALSRTLPHAAKTLGDEHVLPLHSRPDSGGNWQLKGDRWHRPDAPMGGPAGDLSGVVDAHGCGLGYQPRVKAEASFLAIGRRQGSAVVMGVFRVFEERFFRAVVLQAAESICEPRIAEMTSAVLFALGHDGFFALNWVASGQRPLLTSIRPAPRAAFGTFLRGGIDLLAPPQASSLLRSGLKLVAQPHYSSYRRLEP